MPTGAADDGWILSEMSGSVAAVMVTPGSKVGGGDLLLVLESMKMEYDVRAPAGGEIVEMTVGVGEIVTAGTRLSRLRVDGPVPSSRPVPDVGRGAPSAIGGDSGGSTDPAEQPTPSELAVLRDDGPVSPLEELAARRARVLDAARPEAVGRRHLQGKRTARENIADLCDGDSFLEYGGFVIAAQRSRRTVDELVSTTPADGLVAGFGSVNGQLFPEQAETAVLAYDYTVLAGTQGLQSHKKAERLFDLAFRRRTPVVLFAEGGGGRPGDSDNRARASGMDLGTFTAFGRLKGLVPTVGIASGRCFAGNAALVGVCDVVIATDDANIGLGGPAMVAAGGLGIVRPEDIGPADVQEANGVVDLRVSDEAAATAVAKQYLAYFQGRKEEWTCADQTVLRSIVPPSRTRVVDVRRIIDVLCDEGSVLELRAGFGASLLTALGRLEGRTVGVVANDGRYLGGALDSAAADKMARFLRLCNAYGIPIASLCDTPGFMVGPEAEATAAVRHVSRLFVGGPNLSVPLCTVLVRRCYGLGGQAMAGGGFRVPLAMLAWPSAEVGAMAPEGATNLAYRNELDAAAIGEERDRLFEQLLGDYMASGAALNVASVFEVDDVIDPASTRAWLVRSMRAPRIATDGGCPMLDTW